MRAFNFGSLNIDHIYRVSDFVQPGETKAATDYGRTSGGKGLNQSIALARAGAAVHHIGAVGSDGAFLIDMLKDSGVDTTSIHVTDHATGHASIQVSDGGENAIIIYGGANVAMTESRLAQALDDAESGDFLLLQNETNLLREAMEMGHARGLKIVFNASPITDDCVQLPLEHVHYLLVNQIEAACLSECKQEDSADQILSALSKRYPNAHIVMTLGAKGVRYYSQAHQFEVPGQRVTCVDSTAAGDTFTGYFIAGLMAKMSPQEALKKACHAAAISVTRKGAAESIPHRSELDIVQNA